MIDVEGNNGGDILNIKEVGEGLVHIISGSCCVVDIDKVVPVEFITGIMHKIMVEYGGNTDKIIDSFGWDQEFKNKLKNSVRREI